jgi:hypothetical protein
MVPQMIPLEGDRTGERQRQIRQHSTQQVRKTIAKDQVVGALVNHHEQSMIDERSGAVRRGEDRPPRGRLQAPGYAKLNRHQRDNDQEAVAILADQFANGRVLRQDGLRPGTVRFASG